ncbi:hypothetical protein SNEBB_001217 [Seison nebaliae]|nr:hypothetical protein SNEBB_001217 [Seison nebaliae]
MYTFFFKLIIILIHIHYLCSEQEIGRLNFIIEKYENRPTGLRIVVYGLQEEEVFVTSDVHIASNVVVNRPDIKEYKLEKILFLNYNPENMRTSYIAFDICRRKNNNFLFKISCIYDRQQLTERTLDPIDCASGEKISFKTITFIVHLKQELTKNHLNLHYKIFVQAKDFSLKDITTTTKSTSTSKKNFSNQIPSEKSTTILPFEEATEFDEMRDMRLIDELNLINDPDDYGNSVKSIVIDFKFSFNIAIDLPTETLKLSLLSSIKEIFIVPKIDVMDLKKHDLDDELLIMITIRMIGYPYWQKNFLLFHDRRFFFNSETNRDNLHIILDSYNCKTALYNRLQYYLNFNVHQINDPSLPTASQLTHNFPPNKAKYILIAGSVGAFLLILAFALTIIITNWRDKKNQNKNLKSKELNDNYQQLGFE